MSKFFLAIIGLSLITAINASGGDTIYLGKKQAAPFSMNDVDHASWDKLLAKYVDANGRVDYRGWKANPGDVRMLDDYLDHLSSARRQIAATREARLAFWINAYNAVTVRGILREYPTTSIRNHTAKFWGYNIWEDLQLYVGGAPVSLEQMEHEVLRKMSEPRIHFAIVCASVGCPRLLNNAYRADQLESQLQANANDFFARPQNFQYDAAAGTFRMSAILDWFAEDFGDSQQAVLRRIAPWLPALASEAAKRNSVRVSYLDYDWKLNEQ